MFLWTRRVGDAVEASFLFGLSFSTPPCTTDVCMVLIAATVSVVFIRFEAGSSFVASATFTGDFIKPPSMASRTFLETVRCRPEFRVGATAGDSFFGSSVFSFFGEGISISILSANIDA